MRFRFALSLVILASAALLLPACRCNTDGNTAPKRTAVTLAASKNLWASLPLLAKAQGVLA